MTEMLILGLFVKNLLTFNIVTVVKSKKKKINNDIMQWKKKENKQFFGTQVRLDLTSVLSDWRKDTV